MSLDRKYLTEIICIANNLKKDTFPDKGLIEHIAYTPVKLRLRKSKAARIKQSVYKNVVGNIPSKQHMVT